jgi:hypothetical protein
MREAAASRKLRFLELMQNCFPFRWQKYWNCAARDFDLLTILQDINDKKLSLQDRLLLALLARIWIGKECALEDLRRTGCALGQDQRQILADWAREQQRCQMSGVGGEIPEDADSTVVSVRKVK